MTKRDHSAASKKAWRSRKLMKKPMAYAAEYERRTVELKRQNYLQRVLPCPDYGSRK